MDGDERFGSEFERYVDYIVAALHGREDWLEKSRGFLVSLGEVPDELEELSAQETARYKVDALRKAGDKPPAGELRVMVPFVRSGPVAYGKTFPDNRSRDTFVALVGIADDLPPELDDLLVQNGYTPEKIASFKSYLLGLHDARVEKETVHNLIDLDPETT